ncbi:MAG: hypothetical protein OXG44_19380 [Gammaproteobacteria bacterium]|nr:hypothetical protein [Gammaproteobacteria bacterium]
MQNLNADPNDYRQAGHLASAKTLFGPFDRYSIYAIHTRGDDVMWIVSDAERPNPETGYASVIRQEATAELALRGMEEEHAAAA